MVFRTLSSRYRYGFAGRFVNAAVMAGALLFSGAMASGETNDIRLLILGDSLTAGYGLAQSESFPARLERALRRDGIEAKVINAGVSGDTTAGGRSRVDWALADRPQAVIVELGGNDGLRGIDPATTKDNLDAILGHIRQAGLPVLLAGMKAPPNLGKRYGAEFEAVYVELAEKYKIMLYPFFLDGVAAVPEFNQNDGIHPNADGVDVVVRRILPYVKDLIGKAK